VGLATPRDLATIHSHIINELLAITRRYMLRSTKRHLSYRIYVPLRTAIIQLHLCYYTHPTAVMRCISTRPHDGRNVTYASTTSSLF